MPIGSSEHYHSRVAELDAALAHMRLPDIERYSDKAILLALGAADDEELSTPEAFRELLGEMRENLLDLAALAASELTPRERHDRLLRKAEDAVLARPPRLDEARELAAIADLWSQAIREFPPATEATK